MGITAEQLGTTIVQLRQMLSSTPWYRPVHKFRLAIMIETLIGVVEWIIEQENKRSCGCAAHTNHDTN